MSTSWELWFECSHSLQDYLVSLSRPGLWEYSVEEVTDQPILQLVEDVVREKLLLYLHKEIPYTITQVNMLGLSYGISWPHKLLSLFPPGSRRT